MRPTPRSSRLTSRVDHPSAEALLAHAADPVPGPRRAALSAHLRGCASCRALERGARTLGLALRAGSLEPVPEELRRRALRLLGESRKSGLAAIVGAARAAAQSASERLIGMLRFVERPDWIGSAPPALAGVRAAEVVTRCELAGRGYRVEMEWLPTGRVWTLRGRVLAPARAGLPRLVLEREHARARPLRVGARGFFGPVRGVSGRVRARLQTGEGHFLSAWIAVPESTGRRLGKRR